MKIVIDRLLCDSNGLCVIEAPDLLVLDENERLVLLKEEFGPECADRAKRAVAVCPKAALSLVR